MYCGERKKRITRRLTTMSFYRTQKQTVYFFSCWTTSIGWAPIAGEHLSLIKKNIDRLFSAKRSMRTKTHLLNGGLDEWICTGNNGTRRAIKGSPENEAIQWRNWSSTRNIESKWDIHWLGAKYHRKYYRMIQKCIRMRKINRMETLTCQKHVKKTHPEERHRHWLCPTRTASPREIKQTDWTAFSFMSLYYLRGSTSSLSTETEQTNKKIIKWNGCSEPITSTFEFIIVDWAHRRRW